MTLVTTIIHPILRSDQFVGQIVQVSNFNNTSSFIRNSQTYLVDLLGMRRHNTTSFILLHCNIDMWGDYKKSYGCSANM